VTTQTSVRNSIEAYLKDDKSSIGQIVDDGLRSLPVLGEFLREDSPIERTERLEALYKKILGAKLAGPLSGRDAREIARFQKELGFVLKYKSYAVKAATPFGYSIFLQNEREGFSFQRHVEHKLEVFHILSVKPGGYVFLCDFEDWKKVYEKKAFERWLAGEPNDAYDRYKFVPDPGDVFVISELGVVHTVVGCVLEEFATVSTDMVERLHDQNAGRGIPSNFTRANAEKTMRAIDPPPRNRLVQGFGDRRSIAMIEPVAIEGGERVLLCDSFVRAARYRLKPGGETSRGREEDRAVVLRFFAGRGSVMMADASELKDPSARVEFGRGDLILIPPGVHYAVRNESDGVVSYCEHCIAPDIAFI
jgi:mannose-6-phosphate isomerase-like protein (cupin superfamily)